MSRKHSVALLAGASLLAAATCPAAAFDAASQEPRVIFADQPPEPAAPVRTAYAERSNMGGGFIEFLFGDGQQQAGRYQQPMYQQQPSYESRRPLLPQVEPQQSMPEPEQTGDPTQRPFDPKYEKQLVEYHGKESPGTIVIDTPNKFLFLVQGDGRALRYGIGVGKPGFTWSGVKTISAKREWPDWTPPAEMLVRRPDLPRHMEGGPQNPLGARAMYLGSSLYRIHGSNEPWTIGQAVSSGCIRMRNEDVIDLYDRVKVGTKVVVI
jgi:lipoprotein-anchoring transpeptidase ErfK/SrfK